MSSKDNDWETLQLMEKIGGSFSRHIAIAALHADTSNYLRLKAAFPELWEKGAELVQWEKKSKAKEEN
jgi:hypothetical protein